MLFRSEDTIGVTPQISDTESTCEVSRTNSSCSSDDEDGSFDDNNNSDVDSDDSDDVPLCTYVSSPAITTLTDKQKTNIQICPGLPYDVTALLNNHCVEFQVPSCSSLLAQLILSGGVDFEGNPLIDTKDLKELEGNSPQDDDKWISNFVIDSYLQLIKTTAAH